tara:strand:+ start:2326 stop:2433 length:108 start_codon:yes stop_codon:yes gene_type:complete
MSSSVLEEMRGVEGICEAGTGEGGASFAEKTEKVG